MKLFFDTNVYVAEALLGGAAEKIVMATIDARWRVFTSAYVLDEVERVLTEKLGFFQTPRPVDTRTRPTKVHARLSSRIASHRIS